MTVLCGCSPRRATGSLPLRDSAVPMPTDPSTPRSAPTAPPATTDPPVRGWRSGRVALSALAGVLLAGSGVAQTGVGQQGPEREPGSLDKAFDALVGGDEQQVLEPIERPERPQDPPPGEPAAIELDTWRWSIAPQAEQFGRVDVDEGGTVDLRRVGAELRGSRIGERGRGLVLSAEFESGTYDFDDVTELVPAAAVPVESVLWSRVGARYLWAQDRQWAWTAGAFFSASAEEDAAIDDSLAVGAEVQTTYRLDQDFGLVAGLVGRTQFEDDALLLPVIGLDWRIDEDTRLETIGTRWRLSHDLDEGRSMFTDLSYSDRQYRLDGLGPLPGGSFTDRDLSLVAGFDWHPGLDEWGPLSASSARIYAGTTLWRELEFRANDALVAETSPSAAWILGISVSLRF